MGPKGSTTLGSQWDPGSRSSPIIRLHWNPQASTFVSTLRIFPARAERWGIGGGGQRVWGRQSFLFPHPQELYILRVWTDLSTCIKWFVLSDLPTEKILIEKQECSTGSPSCLLAMPAPLSTRKVRHHPPPRHHSALGKPAWVSTLWQREVLKCIFKDVWTDLFERQLELWSNPDVSPCLSFEGRVCLQASDL